MSYRKQTKQHNIDGLDESADGQKAEKQLEQLEKSEETEETEEIKAAEQNGGSIDKYGKFGSLRDLLGAYNALQSEFTKRCQLVKQLQARLDETDAQAQAAEPAADSPDNADCTVSTQPAADDPIAQSSVCDGEARLAEAIAVIAEHIEDCADYLASLPQIADAVILTYKKKLLGSSSSPSPRGMAVVMPARRPRTLEEAKRLADEMLKSGR